MKSYIAYITYIISNKLTQYKIKSLNKKIPILTTEFDRLTIIENLINSLVLDLNDEINNFSCYFQLTNLQDNFLPKTLEDFINLKMKKDNFYSILNNKYIRKLKMLRIYINNKIDKKKFTKKHLKEILKEVLTFKKKFNNKLLVIENRLLTINSEIKFLNKQMFEREINFLWKQQEKIEQKNISLEQKKTKMQTVIRKINIKLEKQLKSDYNNNKFTSFNDILEIPKKAKLKLMALEKTIKDLENKQSQLRQKKLVLQEKNDKLQKQIQGLQWKNNELNFNQENIRNQKIKFDCRYLQELPNKTLINNLTMSLLSSNSTHNYN